MNIQRLKFAWARGARIQCLWGDGWHAASVAMWTMWAANPENKLKHRIHPDDAHMEYGPVAQAFRDMALFTDSAELPEIVEMFMDIAGQNWQLNTDLGVVDADELTYDFARLFVAEYLADEGL